MASEDPLAASSGKEDIVEFLSTAFRSFYLTNFCAIAFFMGMKLNSLMENQPAVLVCLLSALTFSVANTFLSLFGLSVSLSMFWLISASSCAGIWYYRTVDHNRKNEVGQLDTHPVKTSDSAVGKHPSSVLVLHVSCRKKMESIDSALNRIDEMEDGSNSGRMLNVMNEASSLLKYSECWISGSSLVFVLDDVKDVEKSFKDLSGMDNIKVDEKNINDSERVAIMVVVDGMHHLPKINGRDDLKEALRKLCSIPANKIKSVKLLRELKDRTLTIHFNDFVVAHDSLRLRFSP